MPTKHQAHRSSKFKSYYERQFHVTLRNKARRKARIERRKSIHKKIDFTEK